MCPSYVWEKYTYTASGNETLHVEYEKLKVVDASGLRPRKVVVTLSSADILMTI